MPGFLTGPRSSADALVCVGYRHDEVSLPEDDTRDHTVSWDKQYDSVRRPISVALDCHVNGICMPKPDIYHPETSYHGACHRILRRPMDEGDARRFVDLADFVTEHLVPKFEVIKFGDIVEFGEWLKARPYPAWRKIQLITAWDLVFNFDRPESEHIVVKCFSKDEFYKRCKHSRSIMSRADAFKVVVGWIFALCEDKVYVEHEFVKHMPIDERPAYLVDWLYVPGNVFKATDYKTFEGTISPELMEATEMIIYEHLTAHMPEGPGFMKLIRQVLLGVNVLRFRGFTLKLCGRRMSGEMNTSLGNGLVNYCVMKYVLSRAGQPDAHFVVEGDDGAVSLPPGVELDFSGLGVDVTTESVLDCTTLSFCGMVFDMEEMINTSDPMQVLAKFGWVSARFEKSTPARRKAILRCKALSGHIEHNGCPIIDNFMRYVLRETQNVTYFQMMKYILHPTVSQWERDQLLGYVNTPERPQLVAGMRTRILVEEMYGISVQDQIALEEYIDALVGLQVIDHPLMTALAPNSWIEHWNDYVMPSSEVSLMPEVPQHH